VDIEFHYYLTYLIAARAGYTPNEAVIIAHAAQSVDDNHIPVKLKDKLGNVYENSISQTMDITRPHEDDLIYPIFHFIPGDPKAPTARRRDQREHRMNTTPDSELGNAMIDAALRSKDLYRIGVSAHGYVDTWAHQNFTGQRDTFNEFADGPFQKLAELFLAVGHAHAKHNPDWPALIWEDSRLVESRVDNRQRFLDAASRLFVKFVRQVKPTISDDAMQAEIAALRRDLDADIGPRDDTNANVDTRIDNYIRRSATAPYGGSPMPRYVLGLWFSQAIAEQRDEVIAHMKSHFNIPLLEDLAAFAGDVFADGHRQNVTWRDPDPTVYQATHWYRFQEAVKVHLAECADMLRRRGVIT
jgi:hypothetical protein